MSKKNLAKELLAELATQAAADVPPVVAKMNEAPALPPTAPAVDGPAERPAAAAPVARQARPTKAKPVPAPATGGGGVNRTGVNFSGPGLAALRRLQAFFLTECGGATVGASAAVCVALEHAAAGLPGNKAELAALLDAARQADNRRKPA